MERFKSDVFVTSKTLGFDFDAALAIMLNRKPMDAARLIQEVYDGDFTMFRSAVMQDYIKRLEANLMDNGTIIRELQASLNNHMGVFAALQKQLDDMGYHVVGELKKEGIA